MIKTHQQTHTDTHTHTHTHTHTQRVINTHHPPTWEVTITSYLEKKIIGP